MPIFNLFLQEYTSGIHKLVKYISSFFKHFTVPKLKFSKLITRVEWGWGKFPKSITLGDVYQVQALKSKIVG